MRRTLLGILTAALLLLAAPTVAAPAADPAPGSDGLGDPYFPTDGNGGYDVRHYAIDVAYEPSTDVLTGRTTVTARATQALSRFDLDLTGMHVDAVTVDGVDATWTRARKHELVVTPSTALLEGHVFDVTVSYHGVPKVLHEPGTLGDSGFFTTDDGSYVEGEPHLAATWFPANDHPLDKASFDIAITVPTGLQAISNGRLVSRTRAAGHTTWRWSQPAPMAPYLATATTGHFALDRRTVDGIEYLDAVDPGLPEATQRNARAALREEPEIIAWLSGIYGPYPFQQAGGIVDDDRGLPSFSMEIQTRPIYTSDSFRTADPANDSLLVHEISHQWTGDDVSVGRWQDIWLNEGFASYAEWMWSEHKGRGTAQELFDDAASIPARSDFWQVRPGDPGRTGLFEDAVYLRGAMTLHALRQRIGDADFFQLLRTWTTTHAGGTATTPDFIALAEQISGQSLRGFFRTWLYTRGKPSEIRSASAVTTDRAHPSTELRTTGGRAPSAR